MYKIVFGLTTAAINQLVTGSFEWNTARLRLNQHRMLWSDTIMQKYEDYFRDIEKLDLFRYWFASCNKYDVFSFYDSISDDFMVELESQLQDFKHQIIIFYNEALPKDNPHIEFIRLDDIDNPDSDNEFNRYCIPYNTIVRKGSDFQDFLEWISTILLNEPYAKILDRYIFKNRNEDLIIRFISNIRVDTINIYYGASFSADEQAAISPVKRKFGNNVHMHPSNSAEMHDRYIDCHSFVIALGNGLDVFDAQTRKARKDFSISLAKEPRPTYPSKAVRYNR